MKNNTTVIKYGDKAQNVGIAKGYAVSHLIYGTVGVYHGFTRKEVKEIIAAGIEADSFEKAVSHVGQWYNIKPVRVIVKIKEGKK